MTHRLRDTIALIRQATDSISTASTEIASGNADLSSGPLIDVFTDEPQGPVNMQVFIGDATSRIVAMSFCEPRSW